MCPHTPEDYSAEEEVRKLRTKQKEEEALERREDAERRMRGRTNP